MSQGDTVMFPLQVCPFACIKEWYSTLGSIHPVYTASVINPLGKAIWLLTH